MNLSKEIKIAVVILMQVLVILAVVVYENAISLSGKEIFLQIAPVDPRDYLRGDYVTFRYQEISSINQDYFNYMPAVGDTVYVPLIEQSGGVWGLSYYNKIGKQKDLTSARYGTFTGGVAKNTVFLKGVVKQANSTDGGLFANPWERQNNGGAVVIEYKNLEQYFVPEGKGQNFNFGNDRVVAKISVDESGNAVLKQLYVDDKPWP